MEQEKKFYLGDAVYAQWTDVGLKLTCEDGVQVQQGPIYLDGNVLTALVMMIKASAPETLEALLERAQR